MLLKKYLSIILIVVCSLVDNLCHARSEVDVCVVEILDAFIGCYQCKVYKTFEPFVQYTFQNIIHNDIESIHVRRFINYIYTAVAVHDEPPKQDLPQSPYIFCLLQNDASFITNDEEKKKIEDMKNICFVAMQRVGFELHVTKRNVIKVFYEWNIKRAEKEFSNKLDEWLVKFIHHVADNFKYDDDLLTHGQSVREFCEYSTRTIVPISAKILSQTSDLGHNNENTKKRDLMKTKSPYKECIEHINGNFKECVNCKDSRSYIDHILSNLTYAEIKSTFTKFFVDFLYGGISVHTTEEMQSDNPLSPVKFCVLYINLDDKECLDIMEKFKFKLPQTVSNIREIYNKWSIKKAVEELNSNESNLMTDYIEHITKNYALDEDQLEKKGNPESYCGANWIRINKYTECTEKILKSFKGCTDCNEETNIRVFIDFAFGHIVYSDVEKEYTAGFLNYIYTAIDDFSEFALGPLMPKEFCKNLPQDEKKTDDEKTDDEKTEEEKKADEKKKIDQRIADQKSYPLYPLSPEEFCEVMIKDDKENCQKIMNELDHKYYLKLKGTTSNIWTIFFDLSHDKAEKILGEEKKVPLEKYIQHVTETYFYLAKEVTTLKSYCRSVIWQ